MRLTLVRHCVACVNPHLSPSCILGNLYFLLCLMFHVLMLCPLSLYRSSQFSTLWIIIYIPVRNLPLVRYSTVPHSCLLLVFNFCLSVIGTTSFIHSSSYIRSSILIQVIRGNKSPYHSTLIYDQSGRQGSHSGNKVHGKPEQSRLVCKPVQSKWVACTPACSWMEQRQLRPRQRR